MRKREPDFFIHSRDTLYADGPIAAEVKLARPLDDSGRVAGPGPDSPVWRILVT